MTPTVNRWWQDFQFLVAVVAACAFWAVLYFATRAHFHLSWPLDAPATFLYPAVVYPTVEELLFRGIIQDFLRGRMQGGLGAITYANLLTSVLFSGLHFFSHPPLWAAAVFVPSLVFGYFKDRSGRLGAPIALHVFYNSGYFWLFGAP